MEWANYYDRLPYNIIRHIRRVTPLVVDNETSPCTSQYAPLRVHHEVPPRNHFMKGVVRYEHNLLHCLDKPSIDVCFVDNEDSRLVLWYKENKLHRVGGPAYIDGQTRMWCEEDELHCRTGPAWIGVGVDRPNFIYSIHNKVHRVDGPAAMHFSCSHWLFWGTVMPEEKVRRIAATFRRALHRYRFRKFYRMMRWALSQEGAAALWSPESTCGRRAKQSLSSFVQPMGKRRASLDEQPAVKRQASDGQSLMDLSSA